jgi:hypothetical protein
VTLLKFLPAILTEHLGERLELYQVACAYLQAEIPVQAKELPKVSPVSDRDRGTTGRHQAIEQRDWTRLPDAHQLGHVERQHLGEIGVCIEGVLDEEGDSIVPGIRVTANRAQQLPEPDDSCMLVIDVLVLRGSYAPMRCAVSKNSMGIPVALCLVKCNPLDVPQIDTL